MKKVLLLAAFGVAGLLSAKNTEIKTVEAENEINVPKKENKLLRRDIIRVPTVCGSTYVTVYDSSIDSDETMYDEWEEMNYSLCGHYSFENPVT
ncbi:hypothetical protein [Chryseobacterium daeguense]|uniref:hypothetical protein n=1 Tax=Chryseobacterium daeguense TaxID=412438 RepID=UPI00042008EF|nr:hypothetical protein [Chryseobacterium daeguense]